MIERRHRFSLLVGLVLAVFVFLVSPVKAANVFTDPGNAASKPITFTPEIVIPTFSGNGEITVTGQTIANYIRAIFVYFIWIVGILAVVMVTYGGIRWVGAAGNPGRINDARSIVNNSLIGLIIALTSVVLLNTINPDLTKFQGITIASVSQEQLDFLKDIKTSAGPFSQCSNTKVAGQPSQVCSGPTVGAGPNGDVTAGCLDLNALVNKSAFGQLDPFAIKAITMIESPKQNGQPFSGPNPSSASSAYGVGQFLEPTLKQVLAHVNNGGLPPGCRDNEILAPDGFHVSQACKAWLDKRTGGALGSGVSGLEAQIGMIASYFGQQLNDQKCVKGDYELAAAAYNQGLGGASDAFCSTSYLRDPNKKAQVKADALDYIAKFKQYYAQACSSGQ